MGSALQKPLNSKAVKAANAKVSVANTPAEKSAWVSEYKSALKKINNLSTSGSNAKNKTGSNSSTQTCTAGTGCSNTILTVKGIHNSQRTFKLEVPAPPLKKGSIPPLRSDFMQVLGGISESSAAELQIQYTSGKCLSNLKDCPKITFQGDIHNKTYTDKTKKFKVISSKTYTSTVDPFADKVIPFTFFTKNLFNPENAPKQSYSIKTNGCGKHKPLSANVEVISPVGWKGGMSWAWEKIEYNDKKYGNKYKRLKSDRELKFNVSFEVKYDTRTYKVNNTWNSRHKTSSPGDGFLEKVLGLGDSILNNVKVFDDLVTRNKNLTNSVDFVPDVKLDIRWPKITVEGEVKNVEIKDQYMVATEGSAKIAINPLIGATVSSDILDWLFTPWPLLKTIKKQLTNERKSKHLSYKGVMEVVLGIDGDVGGDVEIIYNKIDPLTVKGGIDCKMNFVLKAEISAEGTAFEVFYGKVGALASLQSAEKADEFPGFRGRAEIEYKNNDFNFSGKIWFTGITLYGAIYESFGRKKINTSNTTKKKLAGREDTDLNTNMVESKKMTKIWEMCKPFQLLPWV